MPGGTIQNCYFTGSISITGNRGYGGGIAGRVNYGSFVGVITNCWVNSYININVSGTSYAGGINGVSETKGVVRNCVVMSSFITNASTGSISRIGRITGGEDYSVIGGDFENNYAYQDMTLNGIKVTPVTPNDFKAHGINVSTGTTLSSTWWRNTAKYDEYWGADEVTPWKWISGTNFPVLWFETSINRPK